MEDKKTSFPWGKLIPALAMLAAGIIILINQAGLKIILICLATFIGAWKVIQFVRSNKKFRNYLTLLLGAVLLIAAFIAAISPAFFNNVHFSFQTLLGIAGAVYGIYLLILFLRHKAGKPTWIIIIACILLICTIVLGSLLVWDAFSPSRKIFASANIPMGILLTLCGFSDLVGILSRRIKSRAKAKTPESSM